MISSWFSDDYLSRFLQNTSDNGTDVLDPCDASAQDNTQSKGDVAYTVVINILVFLTVWGISAVVDSNEFKKSFRSPPIYAGACFQFLLMPFIGFIAVSIFPLDPLQAMALLILCASPGGSFSNWWCNLFNADLALSVSMTSLSTVASIGMLPLNILLYVTLAYERTQDFAADEVNVDFKDLGLTLGVVISAIVSGLLTGIYRPQYQNICNIVGNVCGFLNVALGVFASTDTCDGKPPWRQAFYPLWVATAFPLLVALVGVLILGSLLRLEKPQRVAIALETAYQNTSISLAYTVSQGAIGRKAAGIPVIYGGYEAGFFLLFMVGSWKAGWTYAPANGTLWDTMTQNFQPGGDNHKRLFPGYYEEREEAIEFDKNLRKSFDETRRSIDAALGFGSNEEKEKEKERRNSVEMERRKSSMKKQNAAPMEIETPVEKEEEKADVEKGERPDSVSTPNTKISL